jgi:murein DD-endopeptidase MepM/ murein hydrolase activator NlpD
MGGAGGIERAYGREQKRWQCFAYLVLPLCHDPSPVVCGHLHCPEVLVLHPSIKSRLLSLLLLLALALLPLPAGRSVDAATLYTVLTDANFLSAAPGFDQDSIQQVLERVKSPLAGYQEVVGDDRFSAARSFYSASISRDDSLNPQVLLAILHASGVIRVSPQAPFTLSLQETAAQLWQGYRDHQSGARSLVLADGLRLSTGEETNAGTYALAHYYAARSRNQDELNAYLDNWLQAYLFLFQQNPGEDELMVMSVPDIEPFLHLPFAQPEGNFLKINSFFDHVNPGISFDDSLLRFDGKDFTGAGFSDCTLGVNCYGGHNALDYSTGAGMPMLAAASGKVVYRYYNTDPAKGTVDSGLIIDHGNGYRTTYWHMDPIQVDLNANVTQGQQIGLSGNIGKSSGAHLHFGLRLTSNSKSVDPYGWWSSSTDPWGDSRWMWAGDLVADNREAQAQLFYRSFWYRDTNGYLGESYYTMSVDTDSKSTNWAVWGAYIPSAATYNVYAYWPANLNNTRSARYRIFHAGGSTLVSADQSAGGNEFVLLGSFSMARGPVAVILTDFTGEVESRRVYFDAIKWALRSIYPPTDIKLSKTNVAENVAVGTQVATISTTDADIGDVHTYALVSGSGSDDNNAFSVSGNRLLTAVPLDFETKNSYAIRLRTTDSGGASFEKAFTIAVTNVNDPPTSLSLSGTSLEENLPAGTTVGMFRTTDQDSTDSHNYTLVSGIGSTDNGLYTISGSSLKTKNTFNFESKPVHSIRVRVTDSGGLWYEQTFNIQIIDVNEAPTNILLSKNRVSEKRPAGTLIGLVSAVDQDAGNNHTFTLVEGTGSADNISFTIADHSLLTAEVFDLAVKSSYTIRLCATDQDGLFYEKVFTITISPFNEPPTDISLSKTSVAENRPVGTIAGSFSTTDPNEDDTFVYTLVDGEGSTDNTSFTISGNALKTAIVFDFETTSSYSIRVRTTDSGSLFYEKAFSIQITDINEAPTSLVLSKATVDENQPAGTAVGSLSASDPDAGDTHRYSLVSGTGSADNAAFHIQNNQLQTAVTFDYEVRHTYNIRLRVTDAGGLFLEAPFIITIRDMNDAPTALFLTGSEIPENNDVDDKIGFFTTQDQDTWDSHTYHLVPGSGDSGNAAFRINGSYLLAVRSFDYETQTSYSVRVRVVDQGGLWYEAVFVIAILPVNEYPPTDILLDRASVPEHRPPSTRVGRLSAVDADHGDWHTFELVSGSGGQDNHLFTVEGDTLRTAVAFDYELRSSYSIRIRVTDSGGLWTEKMFLIAIEDRLEFFFPFLQ